MAGNLQPLVNNQRIVRDDGTPTDYFIRWAQQKQIDISGGITAAEAQQLIDDWALSRSIISGIGLSGGGNLSTDRTLRITDTTVTPGTYTNADITVDQQGRLTSAANGTGGGGGALVKLADTTLTVAAPTISIAGIPATSKDLILVFYGAPSAGSDVKIQAQFNGDVAANYTWGSWNRFGFASNISQTSLSLNTSEGTDAPPAGFSSFSAEVIGYSGAHSKNFTSLSNYYQVPSAATFAQFYGGVWNNVAAINSILLKLSNGSNFVIDTSVQVYGRG